MTENEMAGWHHWLNGHEFEQTPGDSGGQRSLTCCSTWNPKELDTTQQLKNNNKNNKAVLNSVGALLTQPCVMLCDILALCVLEVKNCVSLIFVSIAQNTHSGLSLNVYEVKELMSKWANEF